MTRKDTIIVAVLINAGLLVMLFVSALKNEATGSTQQVAVKAVEKELAVIKKEVVAPKTSSLEIAETPTVSKTFKEIVEKPKEVVVAPKPLPAEIPVTQVVPPKEKAIEKESAHEELRKVIVKKGDVLEKIAKANGTTVEALMEVNQLLDAKLQVGQVLRLPKEKMATAPIKVVPQVEENFYTIKQGDNLWKIAMEHHVKVEELIKINKLTEKQAKALRPGDRIRLP